LIDENGVRLGHFPAVKLSTFFNGTALSVFLLATGTLQGGKPTHHWKLDAPTSADFTPKGGKVQLASGVKGKSLALDGGTVLELKDSAKLTHGEKGFTFFTWVNPYRLNAGQQMIVAKNVYAKNQREWSVMVDRDNRFTLYLYQGKWQTVKADTLVKLGHWFQVGVVIKPGVAELWVNGKREGTRKLTKPLPQTAAPFTLGGVNDNGRIWQNLFGALDEARFYNRPLSPREITGLYRPVSALHNVPKLTAGLPLWDATQTLPGVAELPQVAGAEFHVIKKQRPDTDGAKWTLGVGLAWHKGKLYASYGYNKGTENTATEEAHMKISNDGGKSWGPPVVMDAGEGGLGVSHGVFLSHQGKLWAFMGAFYAHTQLYHRVHTRAYTLNETSGQWEPHGAVLEGGFWPMQEPLKMPDGNWIMSGFRIGSQFKRVPGEPGNFPAVAISQGDDFTKWKLIVIPAAGGLGNIWGESTVIVEDKRILNIARYGKKALALLSVSEDHGRTWTSAAASNLPMATSKPYAGILSTGQRYLVCTTTADTGGRRSPLTIAVSKPGESEFSKVFLIRTSISDQTPGVSARNADFSYPYAVEHEEKLYIGYTHKSHIANELAVIPLSSLTIQ